MQILIENSGYRLTNYGDVAMLQMAVERVADLWPDATIDVITADPVRLAAYCPQAQALVDERLRRWYLIRDHANAQIDLAADLVSIVTKRLPYKKHASQLTETKRTWKGYIEGVSKADIVLASGGGYINNTFSGHGSAVLDTLEEALDHGKPTAIFGHGFEPISDKTLRDKAERVLPRLLVVGCRESIVGPGALQDMGVDPDKIIVTGDDAIEFGYRVRKPSPGSGIGVNLRVAWYSGVQQTLLETLRTCLHKVARRNNAPLVSLPISTVSPSDEASIRKLFQGYDNVDDQGANFQFPIDVINQASNCRVVVTGSYHAAVFALSQGISAIGLGMAPYYMKKFHGLKEQFGNGCYVLALSDEDFIRNFEETLQTAWEQADLNYESLLKTAETQIALSRNAYQRFYDSIAAQGKA